MSSSSKSLGGVEESSAWEDKYAQSGFFNISSMAKKRIEDKRKRKGLGDIKPREKNVYGQMILYGTTYTLARTIAAPLERTRIIQQTRHMQNLKAVEKPSGSAFSILSSKFLIFHLDC